MQEGMVITYAGFFFSLKETELTGYGKNKNNFENGMSVVTRQTQNSPNQRASRTQHFSTSCTILFE
jgi:hypothetical protein